MRMPIRRSSPGPGLCSQPQCAAFDHEEKKAAAATRDGARPQRSKERSNDIEDASNEGGRPGDRRAARRRGSCTSCCARQSASLTFDAQLLERFRAGFLALRSRVPAAEGVGARVNSQAFTVEAMSSSARPVRAGPP